MMDVNRIKNEFLARIEELKIDHSKDSEVLNFLEQMESNFVVLRVVERKNFVFCKSEEYTKNVVFIVGPENKRVVGNREILAQKSKVFSQIFYGELSQNRYIVGLPDDEPESFGVLVKFLVENRADLTPDNVLNTYLAAQKYDIRELETTCLTFIRANMKVEDAFTILAHIRNLNESELEELALMRLGREADQAIKMSQFLSLPQKTFFEFLTRGKTRITEEELFKYVNAWANEECERQNVEISSSNRKKVLGKAFQLMKDHRWSFELSNKCLEEGYLTPEQFGAIQASAYLNTDNVANSINNYAKRVKYFGKFSGEHDY